MTLKSKKLLPIFLFMLNCVNAQTSAPLKGKVIVDDGYTVGIIKYDKTIDYYVEDSLNNPVSIKKIEASVMFKFSDNTNKFLKGSKNKKKNVFSSEIPTEDKKIENIAILIKINDKKYVAAFRYPKS
ncbi:hypothetical protein [Flavobacterium sp. ACN6]|uniref:hypothetical protein n=1 Tax=Flavobacterium sp. ACN6 TaxID=1920426 RepID=UPI000BB3942A|nr:hypothetical protein [Flavobacterium sp. ACN6]PBJ14558.1 hypothetical protein BSF42_09790 [Flavobacterium sp. ACN6]